MTAPVAVAPALTAALPRETWRQRYPAIARFARSWVSLGALCLMVLIVLTALLGPLVWPHDPLVGNPELLGLPQPPSWQHPCGTDQQGRDMFARLMLGARISLAVGFVSMTINLLIGVGVGVTAAWLGGWVDLVAMRVVDALYSVPLLLVVIILSIFVKPILEAWMPPNPERPWPMLISPQLLSIYMALGFSNWLTMSRLARAEVLNQSQRDYVSAARALGVPGPWILVRHVLPNCLPPLLVAATLAVPEAIFIESFLAFIGLGVSPPIASWGSLAAEGAKYISELWYLLIFPALAISLTMLSFNLVGDGLRDAFDPKTRY